jgi:hypothetical protein
MSIDKKVKSSKPILLFLGSFFMVMGITLVLVWWQDVVGLFKGVFGVAVALGGLMVLYMIQEQ